MSKLCSAKASSMSRWLHWRNHSPAKFELSRPVWPTSFWGLARDDKHVREVNDESDKRDESSEPSESDSNATPTCTCARTSSRHGWRIPCKCSGATASTSSSTSSSATTPSVYEFGTEDGEEIGIIGQHYKFSDD